MGLVKNIARNKFEKFRVKIKMVPEKVSDRKINNEFTNDCLFNETY